MSEQRPTETSACWCGDVHEPHCPTCEKCGAPITTGAMALLCPLRTQCALWPEGTEAQLEPWSSLIKPQEMTP